MVDATNHSGDYRPILIKVHNVGITIVHQLLSRLLSLVPAVCNVATRLTARATSADVNVSHHSTTTHQVQETSRPVRQGNIRLFSAMLRLSRRLDDIEPSPTVWQV